MTCHGLYDRLILKNHVHAHGKILCMCKIGGGGGLHESTLLHKATSLLHNIRYVGILSIMFGPLRAVTAGMHRGSTACCP
jgi:hypothetical protein